MIDCSAGQRFPSAQTLDLYRVTQFGMDVIGLVSSNRPETACSDQKSPLSGHETAASGFADRFRHAEFLLSPSRSFDFLGLQRRLPSGAKICYLSSTRRQIPGGSASADLGSSSF